MSDLGAYRHIPFDPVTGPGIAVAADMTALAKSEGMIAALEVMPVFAHRDATLTSIAISLKRIADALPRSPRAGQARPGLLRGEAENETLGIQ